MRKKTIPQKVDDILANFKIRSNDPQRFKDALVKLVRSNSYPRPKKLVKYNIKVIE